MSATATNRLRIKRNILSRQKKGHDQRRGVRGLSLSLWLISNSRVSITPMPTNSIPAAKCGRVRLPVRYEVKEFKV